MVFGKLKIQYKGPDFLKKHYGLWETENPIQENGLEMKTRANATYGNSV